MDSNATRLRYSIGILERMVAMQQANGTPNPTTVAALESARIELNARVGIGIPCE